MKIQLIHVNMDGTTKERMLPTASLVIAYDPSGRARIVKDTLGEVELVRCGVKVEPPVELPKYKYTGDWEAHLRSRRSTTPKAKVRA